MFTAMRAVMYSTGLCPYCFLAKRLLERRGIAYDERRMRRSERSRLERLGGGLTFPQIELGGQIVDGYTELRRLERNGELDRIAHSSADLDKSSVC
jgi:glutaredoxin 3